MLKNLSKKHNFDYLFLYLIIIGNLLVLSSYFLLPRINFLIKNKDLSHRQIRLLTGPSDNPNMYKSTYEIAYKIKDATNDGSVIFLPTSSDTLHTGPTYQILYPRELIWGDRIGLKFRIKKYNKNPNVYVVINPEWPNDLCFKEIALLNNNGWKICTVTSSL